MLLDDVLEDLRHVENGGKLMDKPLAGRAADALEMLLEINRANEERLAYYKELEAEGRLKVLPPVKGDKCGVCDHYEPTTGTAYGRCKVRKEKWKPQEPLHVQRCRKACADYRRKE